MSAIASFPKELLPLYSYSIALLSAREYSENLLKEKLIKKFPSSDELEVEKVLQYLTQKDYLNERRSIENFIRYRREYSPRGRRLIAQDMYGKKFDRDLSAQVLEEVFLEEDEAHDCFFLAQKKSHMLSGIEDSSVKKQKIIRFLSGKGFPFGMISDAVEKL